MERFIEFVCRPRAVQFETTSSEILLKKCVFVLCKFLKLESAPHLMKTWTVFSPYFSPRTRLSYRTPHSLRLTLRTQVLNALFLGLQCDGHQSRWPWSRQHTVCSQGGKQDHITGLLDAVRYMCPELQQVIPERTRQGTMPFQRRHDAFSAEGLHLACACGEEQTTSSPFPAG